VRPAHHSTLLVRGGELDDLALLHCEWALGVDRFAALRAARLAVGVPAAMQPVELLGERGDRWSFRFSLPAEDGKRTSLVEIVALPEGARVEHVVIRESASPHAAADSPAVVRALLATSAIEPRALCELGPRVVDEGEVPALVGEIVDPRREVPMVLVSVDNSTRAPLIRPEELARRLAGMASVVWLSTTAASRRLKDELIGRGFSEKFGCFHGGVRILWPGIKGGDDPYEHLLLLPVRLSQIPEPSRCERVAGIFCEMIAEGEDLRARLRELESPAAPLRPPPPRGQNSRMILGEAPALNDAARAAAGSSRPSSPVKAAPADPGAEAGAARSGAVSIADLAAAAATHRSAARSAGATRPEANEHASTRGAETAAERADAGAGGEVARPVGAGRRTGEAGEAGAGRRTGETGGAGAERRTGETGGAGAGRRIEETGEAGAGRKTEETGEAGGAGEAGRRAQGEDAAQEAASEHGGPTREGRPATTWSRLADDIAAAAELAEELEQNLDATRQELLAARKALRRAEQERDEAVEARFTSDTPAAAVALAEACFGDRLVVLASARASAQESRFRSPQRIFEALALLAFFGRQDREFGEALAQAMGNQARWRPKDGPETGARFGSERTWTGLDGQRRRFHRHITLGHGVDAQACAQIYYDIAGDGRIEVAWVGEHRRTVSEDT
jgi:hypothetical protein